MRVETGKLRSVHPAQNPENGWLRSFRPLRERICPASSSEFLFLPAANPMIHDQVYTMSIMLIIHPSYLLPFISPLLLPSLSLFAFVARQYMPGYHFSGTSKDHPP
jgi:hypothetical protein